MKSYIYFLSILIFLVFINCSEESNTFIQPIENNTQPKEPKIVFISSEETNAIMVINLESFTLEEPIKDITKYPFPNGSINDLAISPNNDYLYFSDLNSDYVGIIDLQEQKILKRIEIGRFLGDLCISKNGKYIFALQSAGVPFHYDPDEEPRFGFLNLIETENMSLVFKVKLPEANFRGITVNPIIDF